MITNVLLGNYNLTTSQIFLQSIQNASFPEVVYTRSKRGGYQGTKMPSPSFASYQLVLNFQIVGLNFQDLNTQRTNFIQILGYIHSLGSQTLVLTRSDGVQVQIDIKAVQVTGDYSTDDVTSCIVQVTLLAEYPFLQSSQQHTQDVLINNGGGMSIPMGIPLNMSNGASTSVSITNNGNYSAYPTFTLTGILTNPTFENLTTGDSFSLSYTLATTSDQMVVDAYQRTVIIKPSGNIGRQYFTGKFWTVPIGTSNIQLTSTGGGDNGKCTISFRDTYLNI